MKIHLWSIGKTSFSFVKGGVDTFAKRVNHYYTFEYQEFPSFKEKDVNRLKQKEAEFLINKIPDSSYVILLDENGLSYDSVTFSKQMEQWLNQSKKNIIFIVGGAYGFHDAIKAKANKKISLSKMTFSHQLIRLVFMEQLYRCCTILRGEKYHNP